MATLAIVGTEARPALRGRFVAAIFAGSFLLFLVQPMIARMVLPKLGGAPAVWNSAMLVYQALLLGGYAYAHWLGRFAPRRQVAIHLGLFAMAAVTLPIGLIDVQPAADANPFLWVPALLLASIGPLFFVVSAQAPLIQRWFACSDDADPYPLYAASNLGSFAGLVSYPFLVEPMLTVAEQRWLWTGGYALLFMLVGWCAWRLPNGVASGAAPAPAGARPAWRSVGRWVVLAAVPSGLVMSTTLHLTTDIVAMPLLWVVPLGLYLLSFTIAFSARQGPAGLIAASAPFLLLACALGLFVKIPSPSWLAGLLALTGLFAIAVALHRQLFQRRPPAAHLTFFYLATSLGGVLGGLFCALVAPLLFDWTYEHLILLVAAALLLDSRPLAWRHSGWAAVRGRIAKAAGAVLAIALLAAADPALAPLVTLLLAVAALLALGNRLLFGACIAAIMLSAGTWERLALSAEPGRMTRSFFGVYAVHQPAPTARTLVHGTTVHGIQNLGSPDRERMATAYYVPQSGVGHALRAAPLLFGSQARIGVVGLGAGTLACYARPGQQWRFYEIDPAVAAIARDPARFTFLSRCRPDAPIVIGDARLTLEQAPAASADLLIVDAFSSDSVPMHLLTLEAFAVYRRHLSPEGLLLIHITNRHLDLVPVLAAAAARQGWSARIRSFSPTAAQKAQNQAHSRWVAMSPSAATIDALAAAEGDAWRPLQVARPMAPWRDDHASLLPLLITAAAK